MALTFNYWSPQELAKLKQIAGTAPSTELTKILIGRTASGISKQIKKLGLPSWKPASKEAVPDAHKAFGTPTRIKTYIEPREGLRQAPKPKPSVSYPPLDYCMNCHSPVSSWVDHENRMRHMGCKRPAA